MRAIDSVNVGDGTLSPRITRRLINLVAGDPDAATRREQARQWLAALTPREPEVAAEGILQCRDRHAAVHETGNRQGPRFTAASQARCRQSRPDRPPRTRRRTGRPR